MCLFQRSKNSQYFKSKKLLTLEISATIGSVFNILEANLQEVSDLFEKKNSFRDYQSWS